MKNIIDFLEQIEKAAKGSDKVKIEAAVQAARKSLSGAKNDRLKQLDEELSTWQKKSDVILKEPVGREGMAKHIRHWITSLRGGTQ